MTSRTKTIDMSSLDFVLYCLGSSAVLLSTALAIRLVATARRSRPQEPQPSTQVPVPDPGDELSNRLKAFQAARYASPIVRRQFDPSQGPRPALPRPPLPPRKPVAPKQDEKVVPLPVKMKKEPDKED